MFWLSSPHHFVGKPSETVQTNRATTTYARDTIFQGRIAHGMMTAGLISAVIGEQLPGHGTVYLNQTLKILGPARPGDVAFAEVIVCNIDHPRRRVSLDCHCAVGDTVVLKGKALVLAPSRKFD